MKKLLLFFFAACSSISYSQSPIIDYSFLALPPSVMVKAVVEQPDGKILLGGNFINYAGSGRNHLVRLNHDGSVDMTFNISGSGPNNTVEDIALMSDGRIIIGGNFVNYNGILSFFVARVHANGSLDPTFNVPPGVVNGAVLAIDVHSGDKVLCAGEFFVCYGHSQPHITRLNYDGSLDTTFNIGTGFDQNVHELLVLPDARIMCAGKFGSFNGNPCGKVALLTPGGPYDPSMDNDPGFSGLGGSAAEDLELQADGKILVGGSFSYHNTIFLTGLVRLNIDGTRDLSFTPPFYPYAIIKAIAIQPDQKILAGGEFTTSMYNPGITGPNRIARLKTNGTIDTSFYAGIGIPSSSAFVEDITVESDSMILIGGLFDSFDGETMYKQIIRLNEQSIPLSIQENINAASLSLWPNPAEQEVFISNPFAKNGKVQLEIFSLRGLKMSSETIEFIGEQYKMNIDLPAGAYLIRMTGGGEVINGKLLIR